MCIFCAAIPVAASMGAYTRSKQREQAKQANDRGETPPRQRIAAGPLTIVAIGGLLAGSIFVHTQLMVPL
jgi:uncharacterized iron-regulated membrane protein